MTIEAECPKADWFKQDYVWRRLGYVSFDDQFQQLDRVNLDERMVRLEEHQWENFRLLHTACSLAYGYQQTLNLLATPPIPAASILD